jgi:PAT family beta-lactamase induction signal transducer AmpG
VSRVQEPASRTPAHTFDRKAFKVMLEPRYLVFGLFLILAWLFFQGIDGLVTFYMSNELDSSGGVIGVYGTLKGVGMIVGAVGVAALIRRFTRRTAALVTVVAVTIGGLIFSWLDAETAILSVAVLWGMVVGLQWTTYVTLSMDVTDTRIAASMFAILQTMSNIGIGAGEGVATALSDNLGFSGVFRTFALLNLLIIPLILFVTNRFAPMWNRTTTDLIANEVS